jgi:hypothetical protein
MAELSEDTLDKFTAYFKVFKNIWSYKFEAENYQ